MQPSILHCPQECRGVFSSPSCPHQCPQARTFFGLQASTLPLQLMSRGTYLYIKKSPPSPAQHPPRSPISTELNPTSLWPPRLYITHPCPSLPSSPPSLPLALSVPHKPPRCSSNTPGPVLPQGLCICWALSAQGVPPSHPLLQVNSFLKSQLQCFFLIPKSQGGLSLNERLWGRSQAEMGRRRRGSRLGEDWGRGSWGLKRMLGLCWRRWSLLCGAPHPPHRALALTHQHSPEMQEIFSHWLTLLAKYKSSSFFPGKKHVHQNRPRSACRRGRPLDLVRGLRKGLWGKKEAEASSLSAVGGRHKMVVK